MPWTLHSLGDSERLFSLWHHFLVIWMQGWGKTAWSFLSVMLTPWAGSLWRGKGHLSGRGGSGRPFPEQVGSQQEY